MLIKWKKYDICISGANNDLREEDLKDIKIDNSIIMLQQEIPMDTIEYVIKHMVVII